MKMAKFVRAWIGHLRIWICLKKQWMRSIALVDKVSVVGDKVLIIPCDPWSVVGSRGDQAMILACIQNVREGHPDCEIDIMTDDESAHDQCRAMGMVPQATWRMPMDKWFAEHGFKYSEVYILGADVTDGVYGWATACKLLAYYDVFSARENCRVHYLGFSWSETPHPMLKRALGNLKDNLPLPLRDPVSLDRLSCFTQHRPLVQVADAAFCMSPRLSERVLRHQAWVDAQRSAGKRVVAVNVHTMFNEAETKSVDWERAFATVLSKVQAAKPDVVWLFVPHDNRPTCSDLSILSRLHRLFDSAHACLVDEVMNADEIKALVGSCDGLIAGRMHISIAALGMGVPVFGLVYQGKFEGLWRHFGLPNETLMSPKAFVDGCQLTEIWICRFLDNLHTLKRMIGHALPNVLTLSKKNFEEGNA